MTGYVRQSGQSDICAWWIFKRYTQQLSEARHPSHLQSSVWVQISPRLMWMFPTRIAPQSCYFTIHQNYWLASLDSLYSW